MHVVALKTPRVNLHDDLITFLDTCVPHLVDGTIIAITSKIVSLCQGAVVPQAHTCFESLVKREADGFLPGTGPWDNLFLTLKEGCLLPNAGIDASNAGASYILYPKRIQETLCGVWQHLRKKHDLTHLGLLMTDSRTTPLRRGVTGVALGWCGFAPLYSYVGTLDLDGRPLRVTQINLLDALAATAVLAMGEGDEQTPLALITNAPRVTFQDHPPLEEDLSALRIGLDEDLYAPLLQSAPWQRSDGSVYS